MRRTVPLFLLAAAVLIPTAARAQATDLAVTRQQIQTDRQAIVAQNLPLTEAQAAAFWPVYAQYRAQVTKLNDQRQTILTNPTAADTISDKELADAVTKWFKVDQDYAKLQASYVSKFVAVIGAKGTLRFYQIENRLDLIVKASMASSIPLVPVQ